MLAIAYESGAPAELDNVRAQRATRADLHYILKVQIGFMQEKERLLCVAREYICRNISIMGAAWGAQSLPTALLLHTERQLASMHAVATGQQQQWKARVRLHLQVPGHFVLETIGVNQQPVLIGGTTRWLWCWLWAGRVRLFGVRFLPEVLLAWHLLHVWPIRIGVIVILQVCSQRSIMSEPNGFGAVMRTHVVQRKKLNTCKSGLSSGTCVGLAPAVLWRQACTEGTALAGEARGNLSVWLTSNTDACFMLSCGKGMSLLVSAYPGMWWKPLRMLCPIAVGMQLRQRHKSVPERASRVRLVTIAYEAQQFRASGAGL